MQAILIEQNIIDDFPPQVKNEAQKLSDNREQLFQQAIADQHRYDARYLATTTIDPVDAKDFDDALSVEWLDQSSNHVTIGVHIADVSYFVTPKSDLDQEAYQRSFSTYLVDRTIPMLPSELSNDLCSLNPNTDRLAFSGFFEFKNNKHIGTKFTKSVIHSDHRFAYEEAQALIEGADHKHANDIRFLNDLALKLRKDRIAAGAIEFGDDEVKFELDENKKPIGVYPYERKEVHKMVEEFMLLCNQEAAKFFEKKSKELGAQALSVFRVHENPDRDKLIELNKFIQLLGYEGLTKKDLLDDRIRHQVIQKLLHMVDNTPVEDLVNNQMLRAMAKAAYAVTDKGHFGLAFDNYLHFTSPIRRYPDLLVHRAMDKYLRGELPPKSDQGYYVNAAKQASQREINVVDAERASISYKQVEYLQDKVGQTFNGIVSGVSQYGIFVEEQTTKAQGLVRSKTMEDDFYEYRPEEYALVGQKTGKKFQIGDEVKIKLTSANLDRRQLDFELA
jgi:ribonuclease R